MRTFSRFVPITSFAAAAVLGGCTTTRHVSLNVPTPVPAVAAAPVTVVPAPTSAAVVQAVQFGRVTNIEYFPGGTAASRINVPGAVVGGVAGAVAGNALGSGRDAATVLGGAAGAAIGANTGAASASVGPSYRVTIQTDAGMFRTYDVPATGDLRIGDRVRIDNGVIYRS